MAHLALRATVMLILALTLSLVDPTAEYAAAKNVRNAGASLLVIGAASALVGIATGWSIAFRSMGDLDCELKNVASACPKHDYGPDRVAAITTVASGVAVALSGVAALTIGARRMKKISLHITPVSAGVGVRF